MADIADGLVGFIVSTVLIVIFGEILPQAACSRYALQVGARTVPIVKVLMFAFYIVTKPMSIILDLMLGRDMGTVHTRAELMEMMKLQIGLGAVDEVEGKMAQQVAEGALSFRDKKVGEVMTPLEDAYMLSSETRLGYDSIREIFETGFSRVPVYGRDRHDYKGLLITRDLMLADPEDEMRLGDFIQIFQRKVDTVFEDTKLAHVLNRFKKGESHMALVRQVNTSVDTDPRVEIAGILTLEDVVEEIIQEEIVDETDVYVDVDNRVRVSDGRDSRQFQLGVFNPVWARTDRLSREEASAVASHLARVVFTPSEHLELSLRAVEWLVMVSAVSVHTRATPVGTDEPEDQDWLYRYGIRGERCTIVLQGRVGMRVGREGFRVEAGAFSILARDTLRPGGDCSIDFAAHVSTPKVRYLSITKTRFLEAKELDRDPAALERAWAAQASEMVGESSRKEGRILRQQLGGAVPTDPYIADDSTDVDSHSLPSF
jgi:metal transporter CNNM